MTFSAAFDASATACLAHEYLIHDRDAVYGGEFDRRLASLGVAGVRTPPRAQVDRAALELDEKQDVERVPITHPAPGGPD